MPVGRGMPKRRHAAHAQRRPQAETLHSYEALHNFATRSSLRIARTLGRPTTMVRNGLIRRSCALWGRWVPLIGKARKLVLAAVRVAGEWGRSGASAERNLCDLHLTRPRW